MLAKMEKTVEKKKYKGFVENQVARTHAMNDEITIMIKVG